MSDFTDDVLTDDLADSEQVEGMDEAAEVEEELPFLDIEQYKDYLVPVKVDGEELRIPIAEAVNGYQRHADYTRKTQEVKQLRDEVGWGAALKAALDQDPLGTIQLLAANYNVPLGQQTPTADPWASDDDGWSSDPSDKRVAALEARLMQLEQERQTQELRQTISSLQARFEDFNAQEVVARAMQLGVSDLEAVYKMMAFDRVADKAAKAAAAAAQAQQRKATTTAAKREASVVSGGASSGRGAGDVTGPISSVRDAYEAAKRQLGA